MSKKKENEAPKSGSHDINITGALDEAKKSFEEKVDNERKGAKDLNEETKALFEKNNETLKKEGIKSFKNISITNGSLRDRPVQNQKDSTINDQKDYMEGSKKEENIANKGDVFSIASVLKKRG